VPRLVELASTLRSKNAGVDHITFDVLFPDRATFERVRDSGAFTRETVARLYRIDQDQITDFVEFEPANAIKFSIRRPVPHGSFRDADVFGAQQYPPLFDLDIP
jgi:hypothetical protein